MKKAKPIKAFLERNYTMICSLMSEDEKKSFGNYDPVEIILNEIDRQTTKQNGGNSL